ncbi:MAG: glycosyltransferase family 2 protein [Phascolarctobacterium sp.]|nr:glycosyltransferase family 2 protein [Phascolarctobacterium sp.]
MFLTYSTKKDDTTHNLTVIILTKNEEKNIVDVIANAKQVTDKVLIVDSGSADKTVELAEENGAKVVYRAWDNDFAAQRNFALEHVDTEWVLYLDADERMNEELVRDIQNVVEKNHDNSYSFTRKSVAFGQEFNYGVLRSDCVSRLFKKNRVVWVNRVHEKPVCKDPEFRLNGYAKHYTYTDWYQYFNKFNQYTTVWAENAFQNGKTTTFVEGIGHALYSFVQMAFFKKGILDGWLGIVLCLNHFSYTLNKYIKLLDLQRKGR